ncbi:MAG: hypothetical protein DMD67_03680 [Gemmatimonadetes bacterium]|nr:MAG: hypothetical protein DMD67_03680 [Gemmatimonadota bacterium]
MQRHVFLLAMIIGAAPLAAQEPQCNNIPFPGATAACNTAVDGVRAFYPLAGMIVTGGNPVLGTARATGGLGHLTLTARVNGIKAALPDPTAANQSVVPSSFNGVVPAPMVEGAVGLLKGLGGGLLAVDVLGSALVLPTGIKNLTVDSNATHISDAALGIGYGVRVGVLNGGFPIPAVSVSMDLRSDSYRAVAGWKFVLLDVAAGIGVDRYKSDNTNIRFYDGPTTIRTVVINPTNTRALVFVNGGLSLAAVKLVGEIGLQAGKDQAFVTQFSDFDPKAAHVFGGLGIRFGF